jgi:hypothetical protein
VTGQQEIDLDEVVKILNEVHHADCDGWHRRGDIVEPGFGYDPSLRFSEFEAIAIAEKYIRIRRSHFAV